MGTSMQRTQGAGGSEMARRSEQGPNRYTGRLRLQCTWRDPNVRRPFGESGRCYAPSSMAAGSACYCVVSRRIRPGVVAASHPGASPVVR